MSASMQITSFWNLVPERETGSIVWKEPVVLRTSLGQFVRSRLFKSNRKELRQCSY
jgi:hypothetical protein